MGELQRIDPGENKVASGPEGSIPAVEPDY